jgi:hypothetical protein
VSLLHHGYQLIPINRVEGALKIDCNHDSLGASFLTIRKQMVQNPLDGHPRGFTTSKSVLVIPKLSIQSILQQDGVHLVNAFHGERLHTQHPSLFRWWSLIPFNL